MGRDPAGRSWRALPDPFSRVSVIPTPAPRLDDLPFDHPGLLAPLHALPPSGFDALPFGAIGFDDEGTVRRYSAHERQASGLRDEQVLDLPLFEVVAPCMNNHLVAQRFHDAANGAWPLDLQLDYVLTLRMRPQPVRLRLLAAPGVALRYVLVQRLG